LPTVLIISGKEGVGDYVKLVENIIKICNFSMQIVTVCGKNKTQQLKLKEYKINLSQKIKLKVLGLVPHNDLMGLMSFSSVLITKAGGVTPIEAINISIPIILLNIIVGHEKKKCFVFKTFRCCKTC
jgi:processive 1,2-diacylglycerol beta-glucosyltransferase